jgi:multiple sugar transport system permease protein
MNKNTVRLDQVKTKSSQGFSLKDWLLVAPRVSVLLLAAIFFAVPLLWLLFAPSKTDDQILQSAPLAFGALENFAVAFHNLMTYGDGVLLTWAGNSVLYAVLAVLLAVAVCVPAGYVLATQNFPGRKLLLNLTLIGLIMPASALVLPLFLGMTSVKLVNTLWSVVLPSAFFPFGVYLSFVYFAGNLAKDVLNSARIDGCDEFQLFRYIGLPLASPAVSLVAFFCFVGSWNNYFLPFVMLNDDRTFSLPIGLAALVSSTPALNPAVGGFILPIKRPEVALAGLFVIVPIVVIFVFSQRFVRSGMTAGAEKG